MGATTSQKALESVRKSLNKFAWRQVKLIGNASLIRHDIEPTNHQLYNRDGFHLSDQGSDILITNFELAIKEAGFAWAIKANHAPR